MLRDTLIKYGRVREASVVGYMHGNGFFGRNYIRLLVRSEYGDEFKVDTKCKDACKYPRNSSVLIRTLGNSAVLL